MKTVSAELRASDAFGAVATQAISIQFREGVRITSVNVEGTVPVPPGGSVDVVVAASALDGGDALVTMTSADPGVNIQTIEPGRFRVALA